MHHASAGAGPDAGPDTSPSVAETMRLLHRRRGWAWTAVVSFVGLVVYAGIGAHLFPNPAGAMAVVSGVVMIGLLGLTVAGLIVAVVDTVRLHRRDATTRAQASGRASHHPVLAHAYRYPPRHRVSGWFGRLVLAFWLILAFAFLPDQVNAVAYVVGAGPAATFFPSSYGQQCGRYGCSTVTKGTLLVDGSAQQISATWPGQAPLYVPFTVHAPVWDGWGSGSVQIVGGTGDAAGTIVVGVIFDIVAAVGVIAMVTAVRHWLRRRQQAAVPAPAG